MKKSGSWIVGIALAVSMPLVGCATLSPAPLQQTVIDEQGLIAAWSGYDLVITAVDALIATDKIVPGSETALRVQGYLKTAQKALNAATAAQKAGSASTYAEAMVQAQSAFVQAQQTLKGI